MNSTAVKKKISDILFAGRGRYCPKPLSVIVEEVFDDRLVKRMVNTGNEVSTLFWNELFEKKPQNKTTQP